MSASARSTRSGGGPILAFDTATTVAVVALGATHGGLLGSSAWTAGYRHGEELLGRIDALLAEAGVGLAELGAIAVGTGPGAFTGLRVGLATAKGLAHGLAVPIVGVPTASALLAAVTDDPGAALLMPAGPTERVLVRAGIAGLLAHGTEPDLPVGTTLVAVDLPGRAPAEAIALGERSPGRVRGRPRPAGGPTASIGGGRRPGRPRPGVRQPAPRRDRGGRSGGMVARPRLTAGRRRDAHRRPGCRPRDRAGELHRTLATERLPQRAPDEPARPLPGGPGRWSGRGLRGDLADGRRGPHHDLRDPPRLAPAATRGAPPDRAPGRRPGPAGRARRPSRFGCRTCRPGGSTRSSASVRSGSGRATTPTTARTP